MELIFDKLITLVIFAFSLGIIIFIHELGHFISAKKLGMRVEEFGLGIPPRICGIKKVKGKYRFFWRKKVPQRKNIDSTIYSLNSIPLGGFNNITGENGITSKKEKKDLKNFQNKKIWQRATVISAGVGMNLLLGVVLMNIAFWMGSPPLIPRDSAPYDAEVGIIVEEVNNNSPADEAGLKVNDKIFEFDGNKIVMAGDFSNYIADKEESEVALKVKRDKDYLNLTVVPEILNKNESDENTPAMIGITKKNILPDYSYTWWKVPYYSVVEIGEFLWFLPKEIVSQFSQWFHKEIEEVPITGIVGVAVFTDLAKSFGSVMILNLMINVTIALAIFNFLPFPALDGGRLILLVVEKFRGKPLNPKLETTVHGVGLVVLLVVALLVTINDVSRFKEFLIFWK